MFSLAAVRTQLIQVLHLQETPHRTALAFAIGTFIAFAPHYGFHTVSVVFCAWAFRLNYVAVFLGALINNPWTFIPIVGGTLYTGFLVFGTPDSPPINWDDLHFDNIYETMMPYLLPFAVGGCILGFLAALVAYPIMRYVIHRYRTIHTPIP